MFWEEIWEEFVNLLKQFTPYFSTAAGVSQGDSILLGPADIAAGALIAGGVIYCGIRAVQTTLAYTSSQEFDFEFGQKFDQIQKQERQNTTILFPENPDDFNPVGLVKVYRPGTRNGAFINWIDPITNTEVFRWDENPGYPNGPHYHIRGTGHYYPGSVVPEPYASLYFPIK